MQSYSHHVTTLFFYYIYITYKIDESSQWHNYLSLSQHMAHAPKHVPNNQNYI
jgi:hypothetical protein